jgi:carboxyl-terminal processing protease
VWQAVYDRYYDSRFHGVDWWGQRTVFRNLAADAGGPRELYTVLRHCLAALRDVHTRVYSPEEKFDWQHPRFLTSGLSLREIQGALTVVAVERKSEAERLGIRAGDVIETIDGGSASALLEQKIREQAGSSTPQAARMFALASLMDGPLENGVAIKWKDSGNKGHHASLHRQWHERDFALSIQHHRGITVVVIDAFTHSLALEFARTINGPLSKLSQARGIVLDLRNNGGGDAEAMAEIASYFLPVGTGLGQFTDRHGNVALKLETGPAALLTAHRIKPIEIPIVILTSERTSSAAEIFVAALKRTANAGVLGSQTCGCVLAVRTRHTLPDGGELDVSELDYETDQRIRLEGRGITPDEVVSLTRQDIYSGHDRILESAFSKLKSSSRH